MNSTLGSLGPVGLAFVLTLILFVCTTPGGRLKPIGWGPALIISLITGASYAAAGPPFNNVNAAIADVMGLAATMMPGLTVPAMTLSVAVLTFWLKLSIRQVSMMGIVLIYLASNAGGAWGVLSARILLVSQGLAG